MLIKLVDYKSRLVQIMAWCLHAPPLSFAVKIKSLTLCDTTQWILTAGNVFLNFQLIMNRSHEILNWTFRVNFEHCWVWVMLCRIINSLWSSDAIWWHRVGSTLAQVMACCLMVTSHHLNQYWLKLLPHLPGIKELTSCHHLDWCWLSIDEILINSTEAKILEKNLKGSHLYKSPEIKDLRLKPTFSITMS